jgi:hypothetical protein
MGFAVYAALGLFSIITDPTWALRRSSCTGCRSGAFLVGGVTYVSERAPEGLGTTAQAVFTTVSYGRQRSSTLGGGFLYDRVGMAGLFRVLFVVAALSLGLLWVALRRPTGAQVGAE